MTESKKLKLATTFLQGVMVLVGIGAFAFLLWEPQVEGVNVGKTLFQIYFMDPLLLYAYISSIPFFIALYKGMRVLSNIGSGILNERVVIDLACIRYCMMFIVSAVFLGEVFLRLGPSDDRAGGTFMGLLITFISVIVIAIAKVFEEVLKRTSYTVSA